MALSTKIVYSDILYECSRKYKADFKPQIYGSREEIKFGQTASERKAIERSICEQLHKALRERETNGLIEEFTNKYSFPEDMLNTMYDDICSAGEVYRSTSQRKPKNHSASTTETGHSQEDITVGENIVEEIKDNTLTAAGLVKSAPIAAVLTVPSKPRRKYGFVKIISEMINYVPTCVVLKFVLEKKTATSGPRISSLTREVYEAYVRHLRSVIDSYKN